MASSSSSSSGMSMISTNSAGADSPLVPAPDPLAVVPSGASDPVGMLARLEPMLARLELATIVLPSLQREPPPAAPPRSPVRSVVPVEIISISDNEENVDWDLLEKEIDEEEKAKVAKEAAQAGKKEAKEEGKRAVQESSSSSSSSSDSSGAGYCISFRSSRPQMKRIRHSMCCC